MRARVFLVLVVLVALFSPELQKLCQTGLHVVLTGIDHLVMGAHA